MTVPGGDDPSAYYFNVFGGGLISAVGDSPTVFDFDVDVSPSHIWQTTYPPWRRWFWPTLTLRAYASVAIGEDFEPIYGAPIDLSGTSVSIAEYGDGTGAGDDGPWTSGAPGTFDYVDGLPIGKVVFAGFTAPHGFHLLISVPLALAPGTIVIATVAGPTMEVIHPWDQSVFSLPSSASPPETLDDYGAGFSGQDLHPEAVRRGDLHNFSYGVSIVGGAPLSAYSLITKETLDLDAEPEGGDYPSVLSLHNVIEGKRILLCIYTHDYDSGAGDGVTRIDRNNGTFDPDTFVGTYDWDTGNPGGWTFLGESGAGSYRMALWTKIGDKFLDTQIHVVEGGDLEDPDSFIVNAGYDYSPEEDWQGHFWVYADEAWGDIYYYRVMMFDGLEDFAFTDIDGYAGGSSGDATHTLTGTGDSGVNYAGFFMFKLGDMAQVDWDTSVDLDTHRDVAGWDDRPWGIFTGAGFGGDSINTFYRPHYGIDWTDRARLSTGTIPNARLFVDDNEEPWVAGGISGNIPDALLNAGFLAIPTPVGPEGPVGWVVGLGFTTS